MKDILVRTRGLKKYYQVGDQTVKALDGVDLESERKRICLNYRKSGSGKSTLLHMIGGLDVPSEGQVIVDGMNLEKMNREALALYRRRKVGFIFSTVQPDTGSECL